MRKYLHVLCYKIPCIILLYKSSSDFIAKKWSFNVTSRSAYLAIFLREMSKMHLDFHLFCAFARFWQGKWNSNFWPQKGMYAKTVPHAMCIGQKRRRWPVSNWGMTPAKLDMVFSHEKGMGSKNNNLDIVGDMDWKCEAERLKMKIMKHMKKIYWRIPLFVHWNFDAELGYWITLCLSVCRTLI